MKRIKLFIVPIILIWFRGAFAQSAGDTVVIQAFTYESTTRDSIITFPTVNNSTIERVWMRYAMRCKDGLVSPGVSGQTNIGCGEWDYSCSTYLTDSSRIDSIAATANNYLVYPAPAPDDLYSTNVSYSIYQRPHTQVNLTNTSNEVDFVVSSGSGLTSNQLTSTIFGGKLYLLLTATQLTTSGLSAGEIDALSLFNQGAGSNLSQFRMQIKEVSSTDLSTISFSELQGFQEVYFSNMNMVNGENKVVFHQPFNWSGSSNLLIEISARGIENNPDIQLQSTTTSNGSALFSNNNKYGRFIEGSYLDIPSYLGVSGNNPRTIEAWIKTTTGNKNIAAWGTDSQGKRFTFRLHSDGRLRVEINGGFVIGTAILTDNEWHHVAMVLNGNDLNTINFYVDGQADAHSQITNLVVNTVLQVPVQVSRGFFNRYWNGNMDDVRIWSAALSSATINNYRFRVPDATHPNLANLEVHYRFNEESTTVIDQSGNGNDGVFMNYPAFGSDYGDQHQHEFETSFEQPAITLHQADYTYSETSVLINDSIPKESYLVIENQLTPQPGTLQSDITPVFYMLWPDSSDILDQSGSLITQQEAANVTQLVNGTLSYYNRTPSRIELMSFVTPYGINLDLGMEGKAWYFDMTDYLPVLQGNKRISIERGGQWQEDLDLQFFYIYGTPVREVLDLRQIWKVDSRSYTTILDNTYFEPKTVSLVNGTVQAKIRSAISGHGQEGEFIPRSHFINLNNGQTIYNWQVWKECADNPVYPQGGTWIYDRAGWCPGMPTDTKEWDATDAITGNQLQVDYGLTTASGTSNYIVNHQLVSYGAPNFSLDARLAEILAPNDGITTGRINPVCTQPRVVIENTGTSPLTSALIKYSINGAVEASYEWTGSLSFLQKEEVLLPVSPAFWSTAQGGVNTFQAHIETANGQSDEYALNNSRSATFAVTEQIPSDLIIRFKTNSAAAESAYTLMDATNNILFQRNGMSNNTIYNDTFALSIGCYVLDVYDSGDDGISFWANSDGNGFLQFRSLTGQTIKTFEPDFGKRIHYEFTVTDEAGLEGLQLNHQFNLFPNPSNSNITVTSTGFANGNWQIVDAAGRIMQQGSTGTDHYWENVLNISDFQPGIYLMRLVSGKNIQTSTFVKL